MNRLEQAIPAGIIMIVGIWVSYVSYTQTPAEDVAVVDVSSEGRVLSLSVQTSSGHPILDRAALKAVKDWRFVPATRGGLPQRDRMRVPITFRLPRRG